MKKIRNIDNGYEIWVSDEVIKKAIEAQIGVALMPEDWPNGITDENNAWEIIEEA
jgi:hypothetical protein